MRTLREAVREARRDEGDRGAVLYVLVLFLVIFIAVAAVAVDLAATGARGQELQNSSDAASLAGIVEYQHQILDGASPAAAEAAALAVVKDVLALNGINTDDPDVTVSISVSDDGSRLTVSVVDADPDDFLPDEILGKTLSPGDSRIERQATAEFLACEAECAIRVEIPEPITSISARGNGDGYKPIEVGTRLYALNHNSNGRNIVCVDRVTRRQCWNDSVYRPAYAASVGFNDRNPEMPHTAVVGSRIYWTVTDESNGLRLFCWETTTDVPCTEAVTLNGSLLRVDWEHPESLLTGPKDENRGGGTFTVLGNKVFAFSDDHRIHCYDPTNRSICAGFQHGGNPTALAEFPPNDPLKGNHGSSIDRIVDETTGYVYSTLHIPFAQQAVDCASPLLVYTGERVIVVNEETGRALASDFSDLVFTTDGPAGQPTYWHIEVAGPDAVSFQSVETGEYLQGDPFATTDVDITDLGTWNTRVDGDAYFVERYDDIGNIGDGLFDEDLPAFEDLGGVIGEPYPASSPRARWNFYPWQCGDPDYDPGPPTPDHYESGTWLHCYNTGVVSGVPGPCPGFIVNGVGADDAGTPSPIHLDGNRFSGRLWFYRSAAVGDTPPSKLGVCSSGYKQWYAPGLGGLDTDDIEINCVDIGTGTFDAGMTADMGSVLDGIKSSTGENPRAWGDPHWNERQNRLFYPTQHGQPSIVCYDFDTGPCAGLVGNEIVDDDGVSWRTEDYGFISDGNCVFALGHTAFFWAFKASDIDSRCDAQPLPTEIKPCPCGDGTFRWGELDFREIDMSKLDVFAVRIITRDGSTPVPIFPIDGSFHPVKPGDGLLQIPLDDLAIPAGAESIFVEIYLEGEGGGQVTEDFVIRFAQRPRLVD